MIGKNRNAIFYEKSGSLNRTKRLLPSLRDRCLSNPLFSPILLGLYQTQARIHLVQIGLIASSHPTPLRHQPNQPPTVLPTTQLRPKSTSRTNAAKSRRQRSKQAVGRASRCSSAKWSASANDNVNGRRGRSRQQRP